MEKKKLNISLEKKKKIFNVLFIVIIVGLILIKQLLVSDLVTNNLSHAKQDDELMVEMADNLLNGKWLGEYSDLILTKGVMFPLFLVIGYKLGMSYISFSTLVYSLASLYFIYSIKEFTKNRKLSLFIFIVLLFNPVSFANDTLLRVYRNGLTISQVLIIIGSYVGLYMNRRSLKKVSLFSLISGLALASMYHTREDAIWIFPFVFVVTIILIGLLAKDNKENRQIKIKDTYLVKKERLRNSFLIILYIIPLIMLFVITQIISIINYNHYGVYTYNEINNSNFGKAMTAIYSIKPNENIEWVTNTHEKLERIAKECESFNKIMPEMEKKIKFYDLFDRKPDDGEIEDGWFFWVLRESVILSKEQLGLESAKDVNNFYLELSKELNKLIDEGKFERQATMPSSLMPPWRKGNLGKLFKAVGDEIVFLLNYDDVELTVPVFDIEGHDRENELFKKITRNSIIESKNSIEIYGYYYNLDVKNFDVELQDKDGNIIYKFNELKSNPPIQENIKEVYGVDYTDKLTFYENVKTDVDPLDIFVVIKNGNNLLARVRLADRIQEYVFDEPVSKVYLKAPVVYDNHVRDRAEMATEKLNNIMNIYKTFGVLAFVLAFAIYLGFIIRLIIVLIKKKINDNIGLLNKVLILSGIILSLVVLMFGVGYNHISSCHSITYMYLSGAYSLILAFETIAIGEFFKSVGLFWKDNKKMILKKVKK